MRRTPRGHHRILLGAAAGVGKTFRMLLEGQQAADSGMDVVIGYLEPHDRQETIGLAQGLENVPRRRVQHAGCGLEEMDVDAVLRRAPELALIDELAHTNAPGRAKRQALRGHRRGAGRRHRRDLHGQHPAPGEPQRRDLRGDRGAGARDVPRPGAGRRRRGGADRPHPRGAAGAHPGRQGVPAGSGGHGTRRTSSPPSGCRRCASWPCARWPRTSRPGRRRR